MVPPPLTEAVKLGDVDLVRMLLDAHADANSPNQDGETALMLASNIGSLQIAELLIAHGANVNAVENFPRPDRADVGGGGKSSGCRRPAAGARRRRQSCAPSTMTGRAR